MLGYHHRRLPLTPHHYSLLPLSQLHSLPKDKEVGTPDLSSSLQLTRHNLEGLVFKKAYANPDRRSAWVDQVLERVRFLSERGMPLGAIDRTLKRPNVALRLGKASVENLDATLQYYRSLNFQGVTMGCLLWKCPLTWFTDIEGGVKPKVEFLESLGFTGRDLEKLIVKEPRLLIANLQTTRNVVEFLSCLNLDQPSLCMMLWRCPKLLFYVNVEQILKPRLESLRRAGFSNNQLTCILVRRPNLLQYSYDENILKKFDLFVEFGIERNSWAFAGACVLLSFSIEQLRARFGFLLSLGFSQNEVCTLVRAQPSVLARREDGIREKVAFAINVMGRSLENIVRCPPYLVLSLEDRIKPRYEAFQRWKKQNGGKEYSFYALFACSNGRFLQQFKGSSLDARMSDGG